jgi:hypothetical protein
MTEQSKHFYIVYLPLVILPVIPYLSIPMLHYKPIWPSKHPSKHPHVIKPGPRSPPLKQIPPRCQIPETLIPDGLADLRCRKPTPRIHMLSSAVVASRTPACSSARLRLRHRFSGIMTSFDRVLTMPRRACDQLLLCI